MAFLEDLYDIARQNGDFRRVLATGQHSQLVVMTVPPGGEIGEEVHEGNDQILVVVSGSGTAVLDDQEHAVRAGQVAVVPAGMKHNVTAAPGEPLKLFTIYGPPDHAPGTVHATRADADRDEHDQPTGEVDEAVSSPE